MPILKPVKTQKIPRTTLPNSTGPATTFSGKPGPLKKTQPSKRGTK